jgi:DNA repair exonuclease SbcCD ATPase subunit
MTLPRNQTVTENGKTPQNLSLSPTDFKALLTTLEALSESHKQLLTTLKALAESRKETNKDTKALQNVLEAMTERLETQEELIEELDNSQQNLLETLEKKLERNHQTLLSQIKNSKEALSQDNNEIQAHLSLYNQNCLVTWKAAQKERELTQGVLEKIIERSLLLKLGGLVLVLPALLTWSLIRFLPPQGNLLEQIKGRVNNIEIKLNRQEKTR